MKRTLLFTLSLLLLAGTTGRANGLFFIENVGQLTDQYHQPRKDIDLVMNSTEGSIFIGAGRIHYQFTRYTATEVSANKEHIPSSFPYKMSSSVYTADIHRLDLELLGANTSVVAEKQGKLGYYERYYFPQCGENGATANSFSRITYRNIYPNIDWILYINGDRLEYDFIVKPGGDPADIRLSYKGAENVSIDARGDLVIKTSAGQIRESAPVAYGEDGKQVASAFRLDGPVVSFGIGPYEGTLLIDPYIEWATFYGGAGKDGNYELTTDHNGNIYACGQTKSSSFIASSGAYDVSYADSGDAFIVKLDAEGNRVWATYYGSTGWDDCNSIDYDHNGHIYACGSTDNSQGISTPGSDHPYFSGPYLGSPYSGGDGYVVKFDTTGSRIWATYFGGSATDVAGSLVCDEMGNVYVTGFTRSDTGIATTNAYQASRGGSNDVFLAKYDSAGTRIWSTYYGGGSSDQCIDITIHNNTTIYLVGLTNSATNIASPGTFMDSYLGWSCGFFSAFDTSGNRNWGTFFSGTTPGYTMLVGAVTCSPSGDIFIAGYTGDTAGIATSGCYQDTYGGSGMFHSGDAFIAKFSNTGQRIWSTYFGGSGDECPNNIACNPDGELLITGFTSSPNAIAVNAIQPLYGGGPYGADGWIAKMNDNGQCIWSTYWGGADEEMLNDICAFPGSGFAVCGNGKTFPTTPGSFQQANHGLEDGFIARFGDFPADVNKNMRIRTGLTIYPQPNNGTFTIAGTLPNADQDISLSVLDLAGQMIHTEHLVNNSGHFSKTLTLPASLPAGIYILNLVSGNYSATERLIKN